MTTLQLALNPHGSLYALLGEFIPAGKGLLALGVSPLTLQTPTTKYWCQFSRSFLNKACIGESLPITLSASESAEWLLNAPPMLGAEYLKPETLEKHFAELSSALETELTEFSGDLRAYLETKKSPFSQLGRVYFHLAERKNEDKYPFAFLVTYSHKLSSQGKNQHLPLRRALEEYVGVAHNDQLIQLLKPIQIAAEKSAFLKNLLDTQAIYDPQAWEPQDAYCFLKDLSLFEAAGIVVRVPKAWSQKRPPRPKIQVQIGDQSAIKLGADSLLDFNVHMTLNGEKLTPQELKQLLASQSGLSLIRGQWVEVDPSKIRDLLSQWEQSGEMTFSKSMNLLAGSDKIRDIESDWLQVVAGKNLAGQLEQLSNPRQLARSANPTPELNAMLRPYQETGVQWLWSLNRLSLGACLADDMGLGKSIQIISLLILLAREKSKTALLLLPASLIGNWKSELARFAPHLKVAVAHPAESLVQPDDSIHLVMSTYGYFSRVPWILSKHWSLVVLDEAQAIKNPGAKQTQAVKKLVSDHRLALTGTPIENRLGDLWSLFDFLCPGLLGSSKEFAKFVKSPHASKSLKKLIRPYLLRRLKTDKQVISDLPDKTEVLAYCALSKRQAALYQESVQELQTILKKTDGIRRRGIVLAFLMRFKQICNHPSQWLSDGVYEPSESGKFERLLEICEEIASRQEKVLIFTQFKEIIEPLERFLRPIFGRPGLILHGETPVKKRSALVYEFQRENGPPFFLLSVKSGGTGLNLTEASHVIHFDRWWNPAVENQASDRAYRIGQKKNVLVHKFVCQGTLEEKIDSLISAKQTLSSEILSDSAESKLTELSNEELINLVSLDIRSIKNV